MIRVLSMANDSILADALASMLTKEIDLDVIRLTRHELGKGDHHSVTIVVDEGNPEHESMDVAELFRDDGTSLVVMISLKSRNIYVYESYQLVNPQMEQILHIIRDFSRMNLKKSPDDHPLAETWARSFNGNWLHFLILFFFIL